MLTEMDRVQSKQLMRSNKQQAKDEEEDEDEDEDEG